MSNELQTKLDEVLNQKTTYIIPENIKSGVTVLGVEGTLEGLDTSDATATTSDITADKTAYVNGEKITGTLREIKDGDTTGFGFDRAETVITPFYEDGKNVRIVTFSENPSSDTIIRTTGKTTTTFRGTTLATELVSGGEPLLAENIKKDIDILGVIGTMEAGSGGSFSGRTIYMKDFIYSSSDNYGEPMQTTLANPMVFNVPSIRDDTYFTTLLYRVTNGYDVYMFETTTTGACTSLDYISFYANKLVQTYSFGHISSVEDLDKFAGYNLQATAISVMDVPGMTSSENATYGTFYSLELNYENGTPYISFDYGVNQYFHHPAGDIKVSLNTTDPSKVSNTANYFDNKGNVKTGTLDLNQKERVTWLDTEQWWTEYGSYDLSTQDMGKYIGIKYDGFNAEFGDKRYFVAMVYSNDPMMGEGIQEEVMFYNDDVDAKVYLREDFSAGSSMYYTIYLDNTWKRFTGGNVLLSWSKMDVTANKANITGLGVDVSGYTGTQLLEDGPFPTYVATNAVVQHEYDPNRTFKAAKYKASSYLTGTSYVNIFGQTVAGTYVNPMNSIRCNPTGLVPGISGNAVSNCYYYETGQITSYTAYAAPLNNKESYVQLGLWNVLKTWPIDVGDTAYFMAEGSFNDEMMGMSEEWIYVYTCDNPDAKIYINVGDGNSVESITSDAGAVWKKWTTRWPLDCSHTTKTGYFTGWAFSNLTNIAAPVLEEENVELNITVGLDYISGSGMYFTNCDMYMGTESSKVHVWEKGIHDSDIAKDMVYVNDFGAYRTGTLEASGSVGTLTYTSIETMNADTTQAENTICVVITDGSLVGTYKFVSGAWTELASGNTITPSEYTTAVETATDILGE